MNDSVLKMVEEVIESRKTEDAEGSYTCYLFEKGLEFGEHDGLGLIPGTVVPIQPLIKDNKIPHIGWNKLEFTEQRGDIYKYTADGDFVYFVHSYHAECPDEFVTARTEYGSMLTASVQKGNVMGAQYHPEKSGDTGLMILKSFCEFWVIICKFYLQ